MHILSFSKKSLCPEAPLGHAENRSKKTLGSPGGSNKGRIQKLLGGFGKCFSPPLRPPKQILLLMLNHGSNQLFIFPLIEISGPPKGPPSCPRGHFSFPGIFGWCTVHPDQVWSKSDNFHQCGVYHWQLEYLLRPLLDAYLIFWVMEYKAGGLMIHAFNLWGFLARGKIYIILFEGSWQCLKFI